MPDIFKKKIEELLKGSDVKINGKRPWDIKVYDEKMFKDVVIGGSLAVGDAYVDKRWDCKDLSQMMTRIFQADITNKINVNIFSIALWLKCNIANLQLGKKAYEIGERHYDKGNELFKRMLDSRMTYTCGYWKNAKNLEDAQGNKLRLICKKLMMKPKMKFLDIGSGWGSLILYAAENYGVEATGVTVSKEQHDLNKVKSKGLKVNVLYKDYREIHGQYDVIASVGMFEHVGPKNHRKFMKKVFSLLKPDGLFLLHTIGKNRSTTSGDPWITKYIFPNSVIPSAKQIAKASEKLFVIKDWHAFPDTYYAKTLQAWRDNVKKNKKYLLSIGYDERFFRMWEFYLASSQASFATGHNHLWQIVFAKPKHHIGYESVR